MAAAVFAAGALAEGALTTLPVGAAARTELAAGLADVRAGVDAGAFALARVVAPLTPREAVEAAAAARAGARRAAPAAARGALAAAVLAALPAEVTAPPARAVTARPVLAELTFLAPLTMSLKP